MAYLMAQRSGGIYTLGRNNYEPSALAIQSAPAQVRRGGTYVLGVYGAGSVVGNISVSFGGAPVNIVSYDGFNITVLIPDTLPKKYSNQGYSFSVAVTGVGSVSSAVVPFLPPVSKLFTDLVNPLPASNPNSITHRMRNEALSTVSAVTGDQVEYDAVTASPGGFPVVVNPDGTFGINVGGQTALNEHLFTALLRSSNDSNPSLADTGDLANIRMYQVESTSEAPGLFKPIPDITVNTGQPINYDVAPYFYDLNGDTLLFIKEAGSTGLVDVSSTGVVTGTINTAGTYPVAVQASHSWQAVTDTFNIVVNSTVVVTPTLRNSQPINYFNESGELVALANTMVSYSVHSAGYQVAVGDFLFNGQATTDSVGRLPDIVNASLGSVGDEVVLVLRVGDRSIVLEGTVINGAA